MQVENNNLNISDQNYKILEVQAKKILDKHLNFAAPQPGWFETILSYIPLPSLGSIGSALGRAGAVSHGPQLTDYAITKLTPKLFPEVGGKYGAAMLAEAARLSLNPYLLPIVTSVCTSGGGLCLQGAAVLVQWLFSRALSNKKTHYTMSNLPALDQLLKVNQDGRIIDANGDEVSMEDIRQITKWVSRFNLICRLMEAKRGCIANIAADYVSAIDGRLTYLNGEEVSEKHMKILRIAIECLQSKNVTNSTKEIKKAVCLLADNSFREEALVLQNKVEGKPEERVEIVPEHQVEELLEDWCMVPAPLKETNYHSEVFVRSPYKQAVSHYCFYETKDPKSALIESLNSFYLDNCRVKNGIENFLKRLRECKAEEGNSEFKEFISKVIPLEDDKQFWKLLSEAGMDESLIECLLPLPRMKALELMVFMSQKTIACHYEKLMHKLNDSGLISINDEGTEYDISDDLRTVTCHRRGIKICPFVDGQVVGVVVAVMDHSVTIPNISENISENNLPIEEITNLKFFEDNE